MPQKTPRKKHRSQAKQQMKLSPKPQPPSPPGARMAGTLGSACHLVAVMSPLWGHGVCSHSGGFVALTLCKLLSPPQALKMHWEPSVHPRASDINAPSPVAQCPGKAERGNPPRVTLSPCLAGMLVVNVTWRNKTYVGTLLDCTQHDWAPPR